jgi:hypothetical protein
MVNVRASAHTPSETSDNFSVHRGSAEMFLDQGIAGIETCSPGFSVRLHFNGSGILNRPLSGDDDGLRVWRAA